MNNIAIAFMLTLIAGLSTGFGSLIAFFSKTTNTRFLSISLGFSAGVMIYVSFVEIFFKARERLLDSLNQNGLIIALGGFFGGILLIAVIDKLIPNRQNPHEIQNGKAEDSQKHQSIKLLRMGVFTSLAIAIHNLPEGLATFVSAMQEPSVAIPIVIAIALHNIPEGIAVSTPIYYATGSRKKAFFYSFISGLAEPVGALIGYLILMPFMNDIIYGILFAAVAGIMVFISIDELLPAAHAYGEHHLSVYGFIAGMAVMALSLWLAKLAF